MRTRSQARRRRQPQVRQTSVESSNLEKPDNPPIVTMADNRTMAQLLESPTEVTRGDNSLNSAAVSTSSSTQAVSSDVAELKDMVRALILDRKNQTPSSAPVKAVEQSCVTCGGADFVLLILNQTPVPLILGMFLKTSQALIDFNEGEITLRVGKEAITFNLDQTSKYTADYDHMTANKIDVIDMACDEYSQEVLGFSNVIASGNPTPYFEPIVSTAAPNLTPNGDMIFLLIANFETVNHHPPPNHEQYMPEVRKELKLCEAKTVEPSIDEPPEVELKELPPHLEYAFLEGDNKLPVIIAKDLKMRKAAL
ncbi:hypothetical protein Tco_0058386 [Tanacetum coccineum]